MGQNPYQFQIVAAGAVRQAGALTFTDAGNQPGGSGAAVEILGPFHITYQTPGIDGDGAVVTTLDADTLVTQVLVITAAGSPFDAHVDIYVGGTDYLPPDDDYLRVGRLPANLATGHAAGVDSALTLWAPGGTGAFGALVGTGGGAVIAQLQDVATMGVADVYVLAGTVT